MSTYVLYYIVSPDNFIRMVVARSAYNLSSALAILELEIVKEEKFRVYEVSPSLNPPGWYFPDNLKEKKYYWACLINHKKWFLEEVPESIIKLSK